MDSEDKTPEVKKRIIDTHRETGEKKERKKNERKVAAHDEEADGEDKNGENKKRKMVDC